MKNLAYSFLKICFCLLLCSMLSACFLRPYKFPIQQGNVLSDERIAQITPGMSETEVQYLLGTPMLNDIFHTNRWDYIFYDKPGYKEAKREHVAIYFDNGRVARVTRDPLPSLA
jgi:outer membrane protein assembly factor BamE